MISGNNSLGIVLRKATLEDLDNLKQLVDRHKKELGFVVRGALETSINSAELIVAVDATDHVIGFVHYRHRKDLQTTLYNIVVRQEHRCMGLGSRLIHALRQDAVQAQQNCILLKCPEDLSANVFYVKYGFQLLRTEEGKKKRLNIWTLYL